MGENLIKITPFQDLLEFQEEYDDWRFSIGLREENVEKLQDGLSRELTELHESIGKGNYIDIAGEVADVFMFSMTALRTLGIKLNEVPINDGRSVQTFKELQEFAKKEALKNGYKEPSQNLDKIMDNIKTLSSNGTLNNDEIIELSADNLLLSTMIISQSDVPLEDVMTAKHSRNLDKYKKENVNLIRQLNWTTPQLAMNEARKNWNPQWDRKYLKKQLGLWTYARLALAASVNKIKNSANGLIRR